MTDHITKLKKEEQQKKPSLTPFGRLLVGFVIGGTITSIILAIVIVAVMFANQFTAVQEVVPTAVETIIIHASPRNPDTMGNHQLIHIQANPDKLANIGVAYLGYDGKIVETVMCVEPHGLGCIFLAPAVPANSPFHVFWENGGGRIYQTANPNDNPIAITPMNTVEEILPAHYFDQ